MKKYLLGLVAVALTVVVFSAFDTTRIVKSKVPPVKETTELIWFEVDEDGAIQNPTTGKKGAEPPVGLDCEESGLVYCSFGYLEAHTTPTGGGNYTINPETPTFDHVENRTTERMKPLQ